MLNNPYVGPRTFEEADSDRFFGREREARELLALVIGERLTLFYAQSGAGKSSLINTRLIPALRTEGFEVLPVGRVSGEPPAGLQVNNLFVFNLIVRLNDVLPLAERQSPAALAALTLPRFLGSEEQADLSTTYETASTVLVIDQFEEILTTHLDQWHQRADFFQQLRQAQEQFPNLWVVLVMREDYVAGLDPYIPLLPNRLHARFYMQRMTYQAALEAMTRPAAEIGQRPFAAGVAEELVDNLRLVQNIWTSAEEAELLKGEFVEPVQLQVVCFQLWENLGKTGREGDKETGRQGESGTKDGDQSPVSNLQSPVGYTYITRSDLTALAGEQGLAHFVNQALAAYYEQALQKVLQMPNSKVSERELRDWFSTQLITQEETRGLVHQGSDAEGVGGLPTLAVKLLEGQFLLRAENRAGGIWYELVHDRFVQPILQANRDWLLAQSTPLIVAARLWSEYKRAPERLLRGAQLVDAQRYADAHPRDIGDQEREFLEASTEQEARLLARRQADEEERQRLEEQARNARRLRLFAYGLAGLVVVALLTSFSAIRQQQFANQESRRAMAEATRSAQAAQIAQAAQGEAEKQANLAKAAQGEAEQQANAAATAAALAKTAKAEAERQSQLARSRQLAAQATNELSQNHYEPSILLAIEAGRVTDTLEAFSAIRSAIANPWHSRAVFYGNMYVTWSQDERRLLAASPDGALHIWDTLTGKELITLLGHTKRITQVLWNKNESRILTLSEDQTARIWDATTGKQMVILNGHTDTVTQARWNKDESRILTLSDDLTARIWDAATGKPLLKFVGTDSGYKPSEGELMFGVEKHFFYQALWNKDESRILTFGDDRSVRIWDATTGKQLLTLTGHTDTVTQAMWDKNEEHIFTLANDHTLRVWDATTGKEVLRLTDVFQATLNKDKSRVLTFDKDQAVHIWDTTNGKELLKLVRDHTSANASAFTYGSLFYNATWSQDESRILTTSGDNTAQIWDATTGKALVTFNGVYGAKWSQDERHLLTFSDNRTIHIWDATTGKEITTLKGHIDTITQAIWSKDGQRILTASGDGTARIWDATTGQELAKLTGHTWSVDQAKWSKDASRMLTSSGDGTTRLWDATAGQELAKFAGDTSAATQALWNKDESRMLTFGSDTARLWEVATGKALLTLPSGRQAMWSHDERRILTASDDRTIYLWDATTGKELAKFSGVNQPVWNNDGSRIFTIDNAGIHLWDTTSSKELAKLSGYQALWNNDGSRILIIDREIVRIQDATTGKELHKLPGAYQAVWSSDGSGILSTRADGSIHLWDAATGRELSTLAGYAGAIYQTTWSKAKSRLAVLSDGNSVRLWDTAKGKELIKFAGNYQPLWSNDGNRILTANGDGSGHIWDVATGQEIARLTSFYEEMYRTTWSDDDHHILSTTSYGTMHAWDVASGHGVNLVGHTNYIAQIKWSKDGQRVLTASADHTARIWDVATGKELVTLIGHTGPVMQAIWNKDESRILTASADGTVRIWYVHMVDLVSAACHYAPRNFIWEEWNRYMETAYRPTCLNAPLPPDAIEGIKQQASALIRQGETVTATMRLQALNGWLQTNGQAYTYGINPPAFLANVLVEDGRGLARAGQQNEAIAKFKAALSIDPALKLDPAREVQQALATPMPAFISPLATPTRVLAVPNN